MNTLKNDLYQLIKTDGYAFDFILDTSSKGLWYCNLEAPDHAWVNDEFKKELGYETNDRQTNWAQTLLKEDWLSLMGKLNSITPNTSILIPLRFREKKGSVLQTNCRICVAKDKQNSRAGLLISIRQILLGSDESLVFERSQTHKAQIQEDYKLLDEKLRISEERFRGAFEHAAIGMAIVSASGKLLRVNNSLLHILGYNREELTKLTFQDITYPEDLNKDLDQFQRLINGKIESYQMEKRYFHKEGTLVWVILAVSVVKDHNGDLLHVISQITDISKIKEAEQEINAVLDLTNDQNKRLLNFAHIVSHNLRSHSGNLIMLLNFIETDKDEQSRNELFRMFRGAASNLQDTIEHLNEVVAVNTTIGQNLVEVNLSHAIDAAIGSIEALLKAESVTCINKVASNVMTNAVPAYLDSILLNFLTNAIKYHAQNRKPLIELSAVTNANSIELSIKDNGIGIDLKLNRDKLFGMYKTFHTNKDARGIGLFITKNQIEAMGGKVTVESTLDKGTTFKINLKRANQNPII